MTVLQTNVGYARTDFAAVAMNVGTRRERQEDAAAVSDRYLIVADGMGGQPDGDAASRVAVEAAELQIKFADPSQVLSDVIRTAFGAAHNAVKALAHPQAREWDQPATTMIIAIADGHGGIVGGHLGDSRAYQWTLEDGLTQLTTDHEHPNGAITRYVGDRFSSPDIFSAHEGATVVICTDGLFLELPDASIAGILDTAHVEGYSPQVTALTLVDDAVCGGGRDNVTVGVIRL